jgi:hypothetical protein
MVGSKITIVKSGEIKIISEIENIDGVDIFYMSDGTSYDYPKISFDNSIDGLLKKINYENNLNKDIDSYIKNLDKKVEDFAQALSYCLIRDNKCQNKKIKKTKTIKIFGWTITFSKSN